MTTGEEERLRAWLVDFSARRPRYGYRRAHATLRRQGWRVNRKRVQCLWREEGLKVPSRSRKRARTGSSDADASRLRAEAPGHVWALDFQHDQTADGRNLRLLNVVDEHTRQVLACEVARSFTADATVAVLERLAAEHGPPKLVRMDNGPELTAGALKDWCGFSRSGTAYIEPGSPWQNAYVESLNGRIRDELLDRELFSPSTKRKCLPRTGESTTTKPTHIRPSR